MSVAGYSTQRLQPEQVLYLEQTAARALQILERFAGEQVEYGPTALQILDEWIDRVKRRGPLSAASRALIVAFWGQTFLVTHGGYWAIQGNGTDQDLGVVCPVKGPGEQARFINLIENVNLRLSQGITASLTLFYFSISVDLQRRFE